MNKVALHYIDRYKEYKSNAEFVIARLERLSANASYTHDANTHICLINSTLDRATSCLTRGYESKFKEWVDKLEDRLDEAVDYMIKVGKEIAK